MDQIIDPIRRSQLIAALETALSVLRAPIVEIGLLQRAARLLRGFGGTMVEQGTDKVSGVVIEEIADKLGISPETVKVHKKHIYEKTGLENKKELIQLACKKNMI